MIDLICPHCGNRWTVIRCESVIGSCQRCGLAYEVDAGEGVIEWFTREQYGAALVEALP